MFFAALPEPSRIGDVLMAFLSIVFEGAPYILVGTVLSGLIAAFLDSRMLDKVLPKNGVLSTFVAGVLGLVFPVCECAVVPVIKRLVQKGLPVSCAVTYMLAAPIMNPIVAISTLTAFKEFQKVTGWETIGNATMTISRLSLGYAVAVIVGLIVLRFRPDQILKKTIVDGIAKVDADGNYAPAPKTSFNAKLVHAMRAAMGDFLDTTMYFTIGVIITSVFNTQVDQSILNSVAGNEWLALPAIMGLFKLIAP